MNAKKKSNIIKTVVCVVIMAALVAGYYFYISHKDFTDQEAEQEQLESLLAVDMDTQYPSSPRDVIVYYSDLIMCAYNMELTDTQLSDLGVRIRTLFDVELLEENSLEDYTANLKKDVEEYQSEKKKISNYQISTNKEVTYQKTGSKQYASLQGYYHVKVNGKKSTTAEEFLLRKDDDGNWRILGWELLNGNEQSSTQAVSDEESSEKE